MSEMVSPTKKRPREGGESLALDEGRAATARGTFATYAEYCTLPDLVDRLGRATKLPRSRFTALSEIPNFMKRYTSSSVTTQALLSALVLALREYDPVEEVTAASRRDGSSEGVNEANANDATAKADRFHALRTDAITTFAGVGAKVVEVAVMDALKILRGAHKNDCIQLACVLGIMEVRSLTKITGKQASNQQSDAGTASASASTAMRMSGVDDEWTFRFPTTQDKGKIPILHEAIACFLVVPHPLNLVASPGPVERPLMLSARVVGVLAEHAFRINTGDMMPLPAFEKLEKQSKSYQFDWQVKYPALDRRAQPQEKRMWMAPAIRLAKELTASERGDIDRRLLQYLLADGAGVDRVSSSSSSSRQVKSSAGQDSDDTSVNDNDHDDDYSGASDDEEDDDSDNDAGSDNGEGRRPKGRLPVAKQKLAPKMAPSRVAAPLGRAIVRCPNPSEAQNSAAGQRAGSVQVFERGLAVERINHERRKTFRPQP
jgi:hypothetical protein